ncbi:glycosyltransferase [Aeromonas veronii]|uniref:glycosyltransferase n=1 Tax=Aeromonas veronii TaxID=654 RepID=UPI003D1C52F9
MGQISGVVHVFHKPLMYTCTGYWKRSIDILVCLNDVGIDGYIVKNDRFERIDLKSLEIEKKLEPNNKFTLNYFFVSFVRFMLFFKHKNVQLVHAFSNYENALPALLAAKVANKPFIYEVRGFWHLTGLSTNINYKNSINYRYTKRYEKLCYKHADFIVTLSHQMKGYIVEQGVAPSKIAIVPNAVNTNLFNPRNHLPYVRSADKPFTIGFIGTLTQYEGISLLIESVKILRKLRLIVNLVIIGTGPQEKEIKQLIKQIPYLQHIKKVPHNCVSKLYQGFDCCTYPRRNDPVCRYVPPLKVLEAMAMEKAVIVSDLPPLVEMVEDRVTGLVCVPDSPESLAEKIKLLMDDEALARQLGQEARRWVKANRTWEINAKKYMDVYEGKAAS